MGAPRALALVLAAAAGLFGCRALPAEPETPAAALAPDLRGVEAWALLLPELHADRLDERHQVAARAVPVAALRPQGRAALVSLWATYCAPCLAELPILDRAASRGRAVVSVSMDGEGALARVRARLEEAAVSHPNAVLVAGSVERAGLALDEGLPFALLLDGRGAVRELLRGPLTTARLEAAFARLEGPR